MPIANPKTTCTKLVLCSLDDEYADEEPCIVIETVDGEERLSYIEDGEQVTQPFAEYLKLWNATLEDDGTWTIEIKSDDEKAWGVSYSVAADRIVDRSDLETSCGCGGKHSSVSAAKPISASL